MVFHTKIVTASFTTPAIVTVTALVTEMRIYSVNTCNKTTNPAFVTEQRHSKTRELQNMISWNSRSVSYELFFHWILRWGFMYPTTNKTTGLLSCYYQKSWLIGVYHSDVSRQRKWSQKINKKHLGMYPFNWIESRLFTMKKARVPPNNISKQLRTICHEVLK